MKDITHWPGNQSGWNFYIQHSYDSDSQSTWLKRTAMSETITAWQDDKSPPCGQCLLWLCTQICHILWPCCLIFKLSMESLSLYLMLSLPSPHKEECFPGPFNMVWYGFLAVNLLSSTSPTFTGTQQEAAPPHLLLQSLIHRRLTDHIENMTHSGHIKHFSASKT